MEVSGVIVVCSGEIDNHQELRAWLLARVIPVPCAADVAVIPALYRALGEAFIERLEGCFAVAVWDPARGRLLLGRDRCGGSASVLRPHLGGCGLRLRAGGVSERPSAATRAGDRAPAWLLGTQLVHGAHESVRRRREGQAGRDGHHRRRRPEPAAILALATLGAPAGVGSAG